MKIPPDSHWIALLSEDVAGHARPARSGSAILVVLTVLAFMTILLVANGRVVWQLNRDLRLVEKRQLNHWSRVAAQPRNVPGQPR